MNSGKAYLIIPLISAVVYAAAAMFLKRAIMLGLGPWRSVFAINVAFAIAYAPLLFFAEPLESAWSLVPPFLLGGLFYLGSIVNTLALTRGDVSLATPILGFKPVLVAVLAVFILGEGFGWRIWLACFLSVTGIFLMQGGLKGLRTSALRQTVGYAVASSFTYALCDVLIQYFAPQVGKIALFPLTCISCALFSLMLIPQFSKSLATVPWAAWKWAGLGILLLFLQSWGIYVGIAIFQDATGTNIVYSARGVFSVLLVWALGHHMGNHEAVIAGGGLMGRRLLGAALVACAVTFAMT